MKKIAMTSIKQKKDKKYLIKSTATRLQIPLRSILMPFTGVKLSKKNFSVIVIQKKMNKLLNYLKLTRDSLIPSVKELYKYSQRMMRKTKMLDE